MPRIWRAYLKMLGGLSPDVRHVRGGAAVWLLPEREFFIDNLLARIHFIIVMIRWTVLAPWEFCHPGGGTEVVFTFGR